METTRKSTKSELESMRAMSRIQVLPGSIMPTVPLRDTMSAAPNMESRWFSPSIEEESLGIVAFLEEPPMEQA